MTSDETVSQFLRANHWAGAWTFFRELDEMSEDAQLHLLRAHGAGEAAIRDPAEIALRDRADNLLAILELVEVALTAGYLSIESSALRDSVMPVFGNEALFRYATTTYPVPLYGQLKSRVESGDGPVEPDERAARRLFLRFHDLNVAVEFDADVTQFLRFLDDYQIGAASLGEVLRVARNPDEAIVRFAERPADRSPIGSGLHGLRKFLEFCESLDELVHPQPADRPVDAGALLDVLDGLVLRDALADDSPRNPLGG